MAVVLLVERDSEYRLELYRALRSEGHHVLTTDCWDEGTSLAREHKPDLIVFGVDSSNRQGLQPIVAFQENRTLPRVPILVIAPRARNGGERRAVELGALGMVRRPASVGEVMLRVQVALGGSAHPFDQSLVFEYRGLRVDLHTHEVHVNAEACSLTPVEFGLLATFLRHGNRALSRSDLLTETWGHRVDGRSRTIDTHVKRLRTKLGVAGAHIETVRGVGYRLAGKPQRVTEPLSIQAPSAVPHPSAQVSEAGGLPLRR